MYKNFKSEGKIEIIQQWQYPGKINHKLLYDKAFHYCKKIGITSLQSYVTWAEIEKKPNKIDFSSYDTLIEKLIKHKLKWVPFIIMGPNYATPKWFQESNESVYARCLEHEKNSKIQSIWNPYLPKYVNHFLNLISNHYAKTNIFESILLGISGNWGESIYPSWGGFYGGFHTHPGFWCGDEYALQCFREYIQKKYSSIQCVNKSWQTSYNNFSQILFPPIKHSQMHTELRRILHTIPKRIRNLLKYLFINYIDYHYIYSLINKIHSKSLNKITSQNKRWLDFVEWYITSMTNWAEFWVKTARKYFPQTKIYLVTGGHGQPFLGADFSAQIKMLSKYNAGIRITNLTYAYSISFPRTRLISSAARFYNSYFSTEEAGVNSADGITMRVFDAISSKARGAYFKNLIGLGHDFCTNKYFRIAQPFEGVINFIKNRKYLLSSDLIIDMAVLFPKISIIQNINVLNSFYRKCSKLRDIINFDLLDENMIYDGAINNYRFLAILKTSYLSYNLIKIIIQWIKDGGVLIIHNKIKVLSPGSQEIIKQYFLFKNKFKKINKGYIVKESKNKNFLKFIKAVVYNSKKKYPWAGIPEIGDDKKVFMQQDLKIK